jgi:hypothetical protein
MLYPVAAVVYATTITLRLPPVILIQLWLALVVLQMVTLAERPPLIHQH